MQDVPHVEQRGHLTIIHNPTSLPQVPDAALAVYDCPPDLDVALSVKSDLMVIPTNGSPMHLSPLAGYLPELARACNSILFVPWSVRRQGGGDVAGLRDVAGQFPNVKVWDHAVPDSPAIVRATEALRSVWESPPDADSSGAQELARLCDGIITLLGLAPVHR